MGKFVGFLVVGLFLSGCGIRDNSIVIQYMAPDDVVQTGSDMGVVLSTGSIAAVSGDVVDVFSGVIATGSTSESDLLDDVVLVGPTEPEEVIFDGCGYLDEYHEYVFYDDLVRALGNAGVSIAAETDENSHGLSRYDVCYSAVGNMAVINVPTMVSDALSCRAASSDGSEDSSPCHISLNVYRYDIGNNTLTKATLRNIEHHGLTHHGLWRSGVQEYFYDVDIAQTLLEFGRREGDYIHMKSGYGDAGYWSRFFYRYYFNQDLLVKTKECHGYAGEGESSLGAEESCEEFSW